MPEGINGVGRKMVTGDTGLRFALLGRLRAWRGDRELELGSPQQQAFLAVLLLSQERVASVGAVVEALWGGNPPLRAVGALRTYASRLRKSLEPERAAGESPRVLVSVPDGYALRVPREAVDLARFEDHVAAAGRARAAGQLAEARARLRLALEPWQDDPLPGVPGEAMDAHRARLADQRLTALEARLWSSTWNWTARSRSSPSSPPWPRAIPCANGCAPSTCRRCTVTAGPPKPSPPTTRPVCC
ncbi:BTAD domain-containing putative transcriptional regulator [Streptomyces sp. PmtG]